MNDEILPFENLIAGDPRRLRHGDEFTDEHIQEHLVAMPLSPNIPGTVANHLRDAKRLCTVGYFFWISSRPQRRRRASPARC